MCLFDDAGVETRHQLTEHTLGVWHGKIPGVPIGQLYGFRVDGPWDPRHGRRFNPAKLLLDPYARAISGDADAGSGTSSGTPATRGRAATSTRPTRCRAAWSCTTSSTGAATAGC